MTRVMSLWFLLQSVGLMEGEEKVSECLDLVASAWAEGDRVAEVFKDIASLWKLCCCPWLSPLHMTTWTFPAMWAVQAVGFEGGKYGAGDSRGRGERHVWVSQSELTGAHPVFLTLRGGSDKGRC